MTAKRATIAVLVSGGLDSCVLLGDLARQHSIVPIYIRNGLRWEAAELYWLRRFLAATPASMIAPLVVLNLPMQDVYDGHWSVRGAVPNARSGDREVYLPGRNIILLTKAVLHCQRTRIHRIALAPLGRNPFPDSTPAFFRQMERLFALGVGWRGRILTPYRRLTKTAVIHRGVALGLPLQLTFSCLQPRGWRHCGRCNKCAERQNAFRPAGI
jgi:7-cyano-7-deazaguanine synthase